MRNPTLALAVLAAIPLAAQHPHPQPRPAPSTQTKLPDGTIQIVTPPSPLPPGKNFLLTVNSNIFDSDGQEVLNTEPSTPSIPYNLMDTPVVTKIDAASPSDDLSALIEKVRAAAAGGRVDSASIQLAIDILEGNPIPTRPTYSGLPVLHYNGPNKLRKVTPTFDSGGNKTGGDVAVHQIWFDEHIESDVALLDPSLVQDVPWTITYTVDVLHRGADDFAPFTLFFDAPLSAKLGDFGPPNVGMDSTFFPMDEGTRVVMKVKMPPAKYQNLTYTWGWRRHPPRVQVMENVLKTIAGKNLLEWETSVFGVDPRATPQAMLAAIGQIGDLAPEKRMWNAFRAARGSGSPDVAELMARARRAFRDWSDRTSLPQGVEADPDADITLFYVNNAIYGNAINLPNWNVRPGKVKATVLNGDHYVHGYINVDFGGTRGWENQFQSSVAVGGTGCDFTFGRAYWWPTAGGESGLIDVPPISDGVPGKQKLSFILNFEPSARIKFYQFDPYHHDVAVYSMH